MRPRSGSIEMITCTLSWGTIGVIVKQVTLSSQVMAFFRVFLGAVVVLAWLAVRRRLGVLRPRVRVPVLFASGVILAGHWWLEFEAFKRLDVGSAILIVFIGPVLATALAPAVLSERLRPRVLVALAAAFGGIALIAVPDAATIDARGIAAALGSAVLFAAFLLAGKVLASDYEPQALVVWQLGIAMIVLAPVLAGASGAQVVRATLALLLLGVVLTGFLGILFFRALRALEAQQVSVLFYLEPASAALYAWLLLGETPSAADLVGGALIVAAGLAIILGDRRASAPATTEAR
jgi:drug/metabolite transporter (DMT)-like permease